MPIRGKDGAVFVGANEIAEVTSFEASFSAAREDDTTIKDTFQQGYAGIKSATGSISCNYDSTDTNGQRALEEGDEVSLVLYPEGNASSKPVWTIPSLVTQVQFTAPNNLGRSTQQFSFESIGDIVKGTVSAG